MTCKQGYIEGVKKPYLGELVLEFLMEEFKSGRSIREAAGRIGLSVNTVQTRFNLWEQQYGERRCGCGQSAKHRGWCRARFERSAKRQDFMEKWHAKAKTEQR